MIMPAARKGPDFPYDDAQLAEASEVLAGDFLRPTMQQLLGLIPAQSNPVVRLLLIDALTDLVERHLPYLGLEDFSRFARWFAGFGERERDPPCRKALHALLRRLDDWLDGA